MQISLANFFRWAAALVGDILVKFFDVGTMVVRCWCNFSESSSMWEPCGVDFGTGGHHTNKSQIFTRLLTLEGIPNGALLAKKHAQMLPESRSRRQDACFGPGAKHRNTKYIYIYIYREREREM